MVFTMKGMKTMKFNALHGVYKIVVPTQAEVDLKIPFISAYHSSTLS
jgi:hypothetical protein